MTRLLLVAGCVYVGLLVAVWAFCRACATQALTAPEPAARDWDVAYVRELADVQL